MKMSTKSGLRANVTRSRAGHYTVSIFYGPKRVYHQALISSLFRAREIVAERKVSIQKEIDGGASWVQS
jgi:hypothetical protein